MHRRTKVPELVEVERDRDKARSRRKAQPLRFKPVTIGDLLREGKLLDVHCGNCRLEPHLYLNPEILRLPKRMPMPKWPGIRAVLTRQQRSEFPLTIRGCRDCRWVALSTR
jgi:hypothetical protein